MKVAVLWSGGKESYLALSRTVETKHEIACLLTFTFDNKRFVCHPIKIIRLQARALGIPLKKFNARKPYLKDYRRAIRGLVREQGIKAVVTGDVSPVSGHGGWMKKVCRGMHVKIITPLWKKKRERIMKESLNKKIEFIITCAKQEFFSKKWAGKKINKKNFKEFKQLCRRKRIDLCGENGEYHSMVLNAPLFNKKLKLNFKKVEKKGFWVAKLIYSSIGNQIFTNNRTSQYIIFSV